MGAMDFENVKPEELRHFQQGHKEKEYQLIDVRQPDEYTEGHIPGALLLPLDDLEDRVSDLPQEQDIVFYCRSGARSQAAAIIARGLARDKARITFPWQMMLIARVVINLPNFIVDRINQPWGVPRLEDQG